MHKFKIITKSGDFDIKAEGLNLKQREDVDPNDNNETARLNPKQVIGVIDITDLEKNALAYKVILADGREYEVKANFHNLSKCYFCEHKFVAFGDTEEIKSITDTTTISLALYPAVFATEHVAAIIPTENYIEPKI